MHLWLYMDAQVMHQDLVGISKPSGMRKLFFTFSISTAQTQLQQCRAELVNSQAALAASETRLQSAVITAGSSQADIQEDLHQAKGQLSLLKDRLQQAITRADRAEAAATASGKKAEDAESAAAQREVEIAALKATAEEKSRMLEVMARVSAR